MVLIYLNYIAVILAIRDQCSYNRIVLALERKITRGSEHDRAVMDGCLRQVPQTNQKYLNQIKFLDNSEKLNCVHNQEK